MSYSTQQGLQSESANLVLAGPASGSAAFPTYRPLVAADIPVSIISAAGLTGQIQFNGSGLLDADSNLFWDNTNKRLGIGTGSPSYPLDVVGTARITTGVNSGLFINTSSTGEQANIFLQSAGTTKWQLGKDTDDSFYLYDAVNSVYRIQCFPPQPLGDLETDIQITGFAGTNLVIALQGVASYQTAFHFDVNNTQTWGMGMYSDASFFLYDIVNSHFVFQAITGSTGELNLFPNADGYVGISTASPSYPLDVNGTIRISSGNVLLWNTDTGLSRDSAGVIDVGNGNQGNKTGSINLTNLTATGKIVAGGAFSGGTSGDIAAFRSASSGAIYLGSDGNVYFYRDGGGNIELGGQNFISGTDATYNLGSASRRWLNLYLAGEFVDGTGSAGTSGQVLTSTGSATEWKTIPSLLAKSILTTQSAAIGATTIYAIPSGGAGMYRITWEASITTASDTSSVLGGANGFQIEFTNANGDSVVKTSNPSVVNSAAANTTGTTIGGVVTGYAASSTNLQYLFGYTDTHAVTAMVYDLAIFVEYLGA